MNISGVLPAQRWGYREKQEMGLGQQGNHSGGRMRGSDVILRTRGVLWLEPCLEGSKQKNGMGGGGR